MTARHRAPSAAAPWEPGQGQPGQAAAGPAGTGRGHGAAGTAGGNPAVLASVGGSAAAEGRVIARAYAEIGRATGTADPGAVARVVETLAIPGTDSLLDPAFGAVLSRVGVDDLLQDPAGRRTLPLLMLEGELTSWIHHGQVDLAMLTDALTAYVVACARSSPGIDGRERVVWAVEEYLYRKRRPQPEQASVAVHLMSQAQRAAWDGLAARIPWLHWLGHEAASPPARAEVSTAGLVDLLVLLRPRQRRRYGSDAVELVPLPERFTRLYRAPELDAAGFTGTGPAETGLAGTGAGTRPADTGAEGPLARLALALDPLLYDSGKTARLIQSLTLPPALRAAVDARVGVELSHDEAPEHLLVIRVDEAGSPRVLAVNLSPRYPLSLRVGGESLSLRPNAVGQPEAAGYCSQPVPVQADGQVEIGGRFLSLDVPMADLAENGDITSSVIPPELFRGREQQLDMLRNGLGGRGPYTGRLIFGPRRVGKSTLMEQAALDKRLRARLSIDVGNTTASVRDFAGWSREVSRELARVVRKRLPGVKLEPGDNFIETIQDLDDALAGGPPVALCLDEFDALLLPEQEAGGRRAAAKLGNMVFENLLVMGTVQRFHRSVHEFKNWRMVECPADLAWADGITYFLGPLADQAPGPRVEWLTRPAVTPRLFTAEIAPMIGLRPYFWAQLRANLESVFHAEAGQSRLVGPDLLRRELARLLTHDQYLRAVTESASALGFLDPEELLRRDLFSAAEQAVLLLFARLPPGQTAVTAEAAVAAGGEDSIAELLDRAYLTWNAGGTRLRCAVPIFQASLRNQVRLLEALTAQAARPARPAAAARETPGTAARPVAPVQQAPVQQAPVQPPRAAPGPASAAAPEAPAKPGPAAARGNTAPAAPGSAVRSAQAAPAPAAGKPTKAAAKAAPKQEPTAAASTPQQARAAGPGVPPAGSRAAQVAEIRAHLRAAMEQRNPIPLATFANMVMTLYPGLYAEQLSSPVLLRSFAQEQLTEVLLTFGPDGAVLLHPDLPVNPAQAAGAGTVRPAAPPPAAPAPATEAPRQGAPGRAATAHGAPPAAPARPQAAPAARRELPAGVTAADIELVRAAVASRLRTGGTLTLGSLGALVHEVAPAVKRTKYAGTGRLGDFVEAFLPEYELHEANNPAAMAYLTLPGARQAPVKPPPSQSGKKADAAAPAQKTAAAAKSAPAPQQGQSRPAPSPAASPAPAPPVRQASSPTVKPASSPAAKPAQPPKPASAAKPAAGPATARATATPTAAQTARPATAPAAGPATAPQAANTRPAASAPAQAARRTGPPTPAQDAADIARVRSALLAELAEKEVLTGSDLGQLIIRVAPRLRRSGTWAGEPSLTAFFELHFKEFRVDGPSHRWYIRAPQQSSPGTWRKRLLGWLSPADQGDDQAGEWWT